jgi:hypothetical protein
VRRAVGLLWLLPLAACAARMPAAAPPAARDDLPVVVPAVRLRFVVAAFSELTTGHLAVRLAERKRLRPDQRPRGIGAAVGRGAVPRPGGGRAGVLPDPACTPGATNPDVTQASIGSTICRAGYTCTIRPPAAYTSATRRTTRRTT